jgi:uncharacterized cupin superfamily protein
MALKIDRFAAGAYARKGSPVVEEARLEQKESGLVPASDGWFVVNVRDAAWYWNEVGGSGCWFEGPDAPFPEFGINIRVLPHGQANGLYHAEATQEDFLVLAGECVLLVEGEERPLRAWDFAHFPPNTEHIVVASGDRPCVVLMTGTRKPGRPIVYPVSDLARRHGVGVETETNSPAEAYAGYPEDELRRPDDWDTLPWAQEDRPK